MGRVLLIVVSIVNFCCFVISGSLGSFYRDSVGFFVVIKYTYRMIFEFVRLVEEDKGVCWLFLV